MTCFSAISLTTKWRILVFIGPGIPPTEPDCDEMPIVTLCRSQPHVTRPLCSAPSTACTSCSARHTPSVQCSLHCMHIMFRTSHALCAVLPPLHAHHVPHVTHPLCSAPSTACTSCSTRHTPAVQCSLHCMHPMLRTLHHRCAVLPPLHAPHVPLVTRPLCSATSTAYTPLCGRTILEYYGTLLITILQV